jgi:FMN phosphatase YigB (HAD superfamily)
MLVILDLDYTLLDTTAFKKGLTASLESLGVTNDQFVETYNAVAHAVPGQHEYSFERQAHLLHERYGYDIEEVLRRLTDTYKILPDYLYPDTLPFLKLLKQKGIYAALFTWANPDHQEAKLRHLGIEHYLSKVIITSGAKGAAELELPAPVSEWVFINDNPIELRALAERYPEARMIRITRPDGKKFPGEDLRDVPTFTTLEEVRANLGL